MRLAFIVPICVLATLANAAHEDLKAVRIAKPPTIDGVIDEAEWKDVPYVEGLHDTSTGAPYSDSGRFWLAYDRDFVYFAARLGEADPHAIHATEYRTNVALTGDDFVELDLDLSGSLSTFNVFKINPHGATSINIAGGRAAKREWIGEFIAKARITAGGWETEARIPWRAMAIPRGGRRDVRFNISRFVAKNQRTLSYAFVPPTQTALTPTWVGVDLPKPEVDRSVKFLPYGYGGYDPKSGGVFNAGIDMKTALTDQINVVGSINPDFRNIANQILSIDFSRFERLAGESRPFFQEGSQYSNSQIFASQRIPGFDAGINSYGRINDKISYSLIDAMRFGKESDTVVNVTDDPTPNTSFRGTFTNLDKDGLQSRAYLIRASQNSGAYNFFLRAMGSNDSDLGFGGQYDAFITYAKAGIVATGGWTRADRGFNPRLGFVQEVDLNGPNFDIDYGANYNHGRIRDFEVNLGSASFRHIDGSFYRNDSFAQESVTLYPGINLTANQDIADFEGSHDSLYSFQVGYPRGNPYNNVTVREDVGRQAGLSYRSVTAQIAYRMTKKLQFTLRNQHVDYGGSNDQTIFSANFDLGKDRSLGGRIVRQGSHTNAYLAYSRTGNRGIEYFLILGDPNAASYRNSLIFKVTVPFNLG